MISFIIPAYNEESLLGGTLRAVEEAAHAVGEPFEVIVADDGSTDRTAEVARGHGARGREKGSEAGFRPATQPEIKDRKRGQKPVFDTTGNR